MQFSWQIYPPYITVHQRYSIKTNAYQLVGYISVIFTCHAFANSRLHQTTEGWQYIYWWVNLSVVKLTVNIDLSLCDVARQIRDGMSDI